MRRDQTSLILTPGEGDNGMSVAPPQVVASRLNSIYPMESNGGHFLTLIYGVVDLRDCRLDYCCAGHNGPLLVRGGETPKSYDVPSFPVGIAPDPDYEDAQLELRTGDRVYFYSDGVIEAADPEHQLFGCERLGRVVEEARSGSLRDSVDAIVQATTDWQGSDRFKDDLSVLAVQVGEG